MNKLACVVAGALVSLAVSDAAFAQQEPGRVGFGPPEDVSLEVTVAADGGLTLSQSEIGLAWGGYYRFNFVCPAGLENEAGISFDAQALWRNSHMRIISVANTELGEQPVPEINFHLQGLNFRLIDCEGLALTARFSFHPMRKGTYPFTVRNSEHEVIGEFIVE